MLEHIFQNRLHTIINFLFLKRVIFEDAGLACMFVISRYPIGAPVTERAIPVAIYQVKGTFEKVLKNAISRKKSYLSRKK